MIKKIVALLMLLMVVGVGYAQFNPRADIDFKNLWGFYNGTNGTIGNLTIINNLTVKSLNSTGCDLKTNANGIFYCGTDLSGIGSVSIPAENVTEGTLFDGRLSSNITKLGGTIEIAEITAGTFGAGFVWNGEPILQLYLGGITIPIANATGTIPQSRMSITGLEIANTTGEFPQSRMSITIPIANATGTIPQNRLSITIPFGNSTGRNGTMVTDVVQSINNNWGNFTFATTGVQFISTSGNTFTWGLGGITLPMGNITNLIAAFQESNNTKANQTDLKNTQNNLSQVSNNLSLANASATKLDAREAANNLTQSNQIDAININLGNTGWHTDGLVTYNDTPGAIVCIGCTSGPEKLNVVGSFNVTGNNNASYYFGSGLWLSDLAYQHVHNASNITSGTLDDRWLSSNVTKFGTNLNSKATSSGENITSGTIADARLSTNVTKFGTNLNSKATSSGENITSGTIDDLRLSTNVTKFGTNLNSKATSTGENITSGTISDLRLSANITRTNAQNNFTMNQQIAGNMNVTGTTNSTKVVATEYYIVDTNSVCKEKKYYDGTYIVETVC